LKDVPMSFRTGTGSGLAEPISRMRQCPEMDGTDDDFASARKV